MLTDLTRESGSFWIVAAIDRLPAISDGTISVQCRHMNFRTANKTLLQLAFSSLGPPDTPLQNPVVPRNPV